MKFAPEEGSGAEVERKNPMDEYRELKSFLNEALRLKAIPAKSRKKLTALHYLAGKFEVDRQYTESEVNDILDDWTEFHDPATLRRELFNKHLLNRTPDCRAYWREDVPELEVFLEKFL